ncbi:MAG: T9SS C-terminal target domain-containing protein [Saprospirales bacterium]|nr:MAG: T9SS C-terminal target domain-containing protein [Saprospirales bacterium]
MKSSFFLLPLLFFGTLNMCFSQVPFIEVLNPNEVSLDSTEAVRYDSIVGFGENYQKYLIRINPIQNYVSLDTITISIPLAEIGEIQFVTTAIEYRNDSSFSLTGYNLSGGFLNFTLLESEIGANMFIPESQSLYQFNSISESYAVMLRYPNWTGFESIGCITTGEDGDQEDYYPDEFSGPDSLNYAQERSICDHNRIRVLVLFTTQGRNESFLRGSNMNRDAQRLIDELNLSIANTGISRSRISFALADTRLLGSFVEDDEDEDIQGDVELLSNNQEAQEMRDEVLADIVVLITGNVYGNIFGVARDIRASESRAYAISTYEFTFNGNLTGTHEIGHLIGTRHQRCRRCPSACDPKWSKYKGYKVGSDMRTIMHVQGCGRTRVNVWSSSGAKFMGQSTGNTNNRNSGILKNRASKVACFREGVPPIPPPPPLSIYYIEGPLFLCPDNAFPQYEVHYNQNVFQNPIFNWDISENGLFNWTTIIGKIKNGNPVTLTQPNNLPDVFWLRATVSDPSGTTASTTIQVRKRDEPYSCNTFLRILREANEQDGTNSEYILYPNPTNNDIFVSGIVGKVWYKIFSSAGELIKIGTDNLSKDQELNISLTYFPAGLYFMELIMENNESHVMKLVKK